MRSVVVWLLIAVAVAEVIDEPVQEEDLEDPYGDEYDHSRRKREVYVENPLEEHIRVKRCCEDGERERRSAELLRRPRQVHQYEVHEFNDETLEPSSPPYEEMLVASANHYHRAYAAPESLRAARYLDVDAPQNVLQNDGSLINAQSVSPPAHFLKTASPVLVPNSEPITSDTAPVQFAPRPTPEQFVAHPAPVQFAAHQAPVQFSAQPAAAHYAPQSAPVPIPVAGAVYPPLQKLAPSDQLISATGHKQSHGHGHTQGGGHAQHSHHHGSHGDKTNKGYKQDEFLDKGTKGHKTDEHHRREYEEANGKKKKHHDHAGHKGSHDEEAHGQKGSKFAEKKGHKKGHKTKGYHNKYAKDEFHKEHKFYDDYHKSGEHHRFGKFNAKHNSNESGKKKAHHVNAGHDFVERGKKGYSHKGHIDADHKGHKGKEGHEEHHQHHSQHGKKGGKEGGSHWGYAKKN